MIEEALHYRNLGISLIPVVGKSAAVKWAPFQRQKPTERQIAFWFRNDHVYTGLALIAGDISDGLAVRDFDDRTIQDRWQNEHSELASSLPTVETKRGAHLYCRAARGSLEAVRTLLGCDGVGAIELEGGELRADMGCYTVAPPSNHPDGGKYQWIRPLDDSPPEVDLREFLSSEELTHREHKTCPVSSVSSECSMTSEYSVPSMSSVFSVSSVCQTVEEAIAVTLPREPGYRHRLVFNFARHLKAIPSLADADVRALKPYVKQWHSRALPFIATKPFEETWLDFAEGWKRIRYPAGEEPILKLFQASLEKELPLVAEQYESVELQQLIRLCRELHCHFGKNSFYLDGRKAGKLLRVSHSQAARWFRLLILDHVLELVTPGSRHKAAEYRFLGDGVVT